MFVDLPKAYDNVPSTKAVKNLKKDLKFSCECRTKNIKILQ